MYTSISVHFENGQVILDEPLHVENKTKGILTILETPSKESSHASVSSTEIMKSIRETNPFKEIEDPSQWQKEIRKDRNLL